MIELRDLQVLGSSSEPLLRGVGLSVAAGERVALVGRNGAGKSTLLRALSGFCAIERGSVRVAGTELSSRGGAARLRRLRSLVAQVHQGLHQVGRLSALDNVLIGGAARDGSPRTWLRHWPEAERRAAQEALARLGLGWAGARRTDTLSGGERQKVAIARALHQGAPVLLADEPTASLDAEAACDLVDLLGAVASERGVALLCVVHDLNLVPRFAQRVVVLRGGSVVCDRAVDANTPLQLQGLLK